MAPMNSLGVLVYRVVERVKVIVIVMLGLEVTPGMGMEVTLRMGMEVTLRREVTPGMGMEVTLGMGIKVILRMEVEVVKSEVMVVMEVGLGVVGVNLRMMMIMMVNLRMMNQTAIANVTVERKLMIFTLLPIILRISHLIWKMNR